MIGFELSKEQRKLVKETRDLVRAEITPKSLELDVRGDESFDWSLINILAQHNLTCPIISKEYGGLGLSYLTTALVLEEIAKGCAGLSAVVNTNMHAVSPILAVGTKNQKETFLPLMTAATPVLASFALTEPNAGSDVSSISTVAQKDRNGYLINGVKDYVLNASVSSFFTVFATSSPFQGRASLRAFLIPSSTPGLSIGKIRKKAGIRYCNTSEVIMDHVGVAKDNLLGGDSSGSGYLILTQALDRGRALVGAASVGIAQAAYELALNYACTRIQFGKPIIKHQAVAFDLAKMATKIEQARLMTWKACYLIDHEQDYTIASSMAKLVASEVAQEVTSMAVEIFGARGYMAESLADKYSRDARSLAAVEGTNNIQKAIIASLLPTLI